jgi:RHS repeat-associated protein
LKGGDSTGYESKLFFYHGNHLSSTQMITDINAKVVQQVLYAPFGEVITEYNAYWHNGLVPDYMFNAKELDEESGMYYYEARYYNPPTFISRDPLFEQKPFMSPYAYCRNNPLNMIDPDGQDEYGLDEATGRLSLIKVDRSQENDFILVGSFNNKGEFSENKDKDIHVMSKGILNAKDKETDLSKTGIPVPGGKQGEGIDMMKFISFNCNKEMSAWGYTNNKGQDGLEIAPWENNTCTTAHRDNYTISGSFDKIGKRTFFIHTHPSCKNGGGGYGYPSDADKQNVNYGVPHYILSKHHGLTRYYKDKRVVTPNKNSLPPSLSKHVK